jgi:hypothetical protein
MLQQMPENARTFYQTLDGQVEQNKIYTKLAIPTHDESIWLGESTLKFLK